jgi:choline dehydrogenase
MQDTDYIIIGAGSAGCALAYRLTESGKHRVTVLEAGGTDRRFFVQMPLGYGKLFYNPAVNWLYSAEPDPGLNGQRDHIPRGKILGGSSSINAMVWIRGHRADYDEWGAENPGWGWDEVLSAFRQIEDNEAGADQWRGKGRCSSAATVRGCIGWSKITSPPAVRRGCPITTISTGPSRKAPAPIR